MNGSLEEFFGRPVGIMSWVYSTEARKIAEGAVADGFTCIQWSTTEPTEAAAKEAAKVFADSGLDVVAISGYQNLVAVDPGRREGGINQIERYLDVCPFFPKCKGVATETGTKNAKSEWHYHPDNCLSEVWDEMVGALGRLGARAGRNRTKVLIEGYVENIVRTAADCSRLRKELGMEQFGFIMDPFNLILEERLPTMRDEILRIFEAMGTDAVIAHAKDLVYRDGIVDTPRSGTGIFDFQTYFHLLDTRLPGVPLILEHLGAHEVQSSVDYLKSEYERYLKTRS